MGDPYVVNLLVDSIHVYNKSKLLDGGPQVVVEIVIREFQAKKICFCVGKLKIKLVANVFSWKGSRVYPQLY